MPVVHDPVAFSLIGIDVRWYGLFILSGILCGIAVVRWVAAKRGLDPEFALDAAPIVLIVAVLGARLYFILLEFGMYAHDPGRLLTLQLQGLTIHGALVGGVLAFAWYCKRRHQSILIWADVVIVGVPIGQAIGRWGNWTNQEAFGTPTDVPWAVTIDPARRPPEYATFSTFHPTFLYEGLLNLCVAAVLIWLVQRVPRDRRLRDGDVLATYAILYGLVRLVIERVRTDSLYIGPIQAAYWFSGALILFGCVSIVVRRSGPLAARFSPGVTQ